MSIASESQRTEVIEQYFDSIFREYQAMYDEAEDLSRFPSGATRMRKTLEMLEVGTGGSKGRVADLGCGTGIVALEAAAAGWRADGIDISSRMIEQANELARDRQLTAQTHFAMDSVLDSQLESGAYDAVIALGLIEYLDEDEAFYREVQRLLKPGGVAIIAYRNRLFNLFSLNQATQSEVEAGHYSQLLNELHELLKQGCSESDLQAAEVARETVAETAEQNEASRQNQEFKFVHPLRLRQHTPASCDAAKLFGLELIDLRYFHFHPYPPVFEQAASKIFNAAALSMEVLDRTPIGAVMSSAFIASYRMGE